MACRFTELCIDCADADRLAAFWAEVLGYDETDREEDAVELSPPDGVGPSLLLIEVPEPKTVKNRLHIDVNPTDRDRDAEVARLEALGARRIDIGQGEQSWVVLADPEGNEFCVLGRRID